MNIFWFIFLICQLALDALFISMFNSQSRINKLQLHLFIELVVTIKELVKDAERREVKNDKKRRTGNGRVGK